MLEQFLAIASVAVRHLGAYTELLGSDLAAARRAAIDQLWAGVVLAAAGLLAAILLCLWIVALTWDTDYRSAAIASLAAFFAAVAVGAWVRLRATGRRVPSLLDRTARAWEQDRMLLQELISRREPLPRESSPQ